MSRHLGEPDQVELEIAVEEVEVMDLLHPICADRNGRAANASGMSGGQELEDDVELGIEGGTNARVIGPGAAPVA